ncbi:MAG TPA: TonB-dependent receptor [Azospirillaceae bacterium]|nr:TonB-dependent receptor [Azospirillaceae bacterium]
MTRKTPTGAPWLAPLALPFLLPTAAAAQGTTYELPSVVVSATRSVEDIKSIPGSVTVIDREEIARQSKVTRSLSEILAREVPGLATSTHGNTNSTQTLRGRNILVLIDGVPQTTTRNVSRDLFTIDPAAVERVEVVRGATAIYGNGASGGVINIITRKAGGPAPVFDTEAGLTTSLTNPGLDALSGRIQQGVTGGLGKVDYTFRAAAEKTGGFFDAEGDRIPPDPSQGDLSDTRKLNLLGKIGVSLSDEQRLSLTFNHLDTQQDTDYLSDRSVVAFPRGGVKARATKGLVLADQPETVNTLASLDYEHGNVLGSRLHAQAYHRDYRTRFYPFDGRALPVWNSAAQTYLESETVGGRVALETPVNLVGKDDLTILWGVDYNREETAQPATVYDPAVFAASSGRIFRKLGDRTFVPPVTHTSVGLFAQGEWQATNDLVLRAGLRQEFIKAEHDDFTTLGQGNRIAAGSASYSDTLLNLGAVYYLTKDVDVFANWSQGFSLPDVGLVLRGAPRGFSLNSATLLPIKVDNYEVGTRATWGVLTGSVTAFYTESELGASSNGFTATVVRAPERTYGLELALDAAVSDQWTLGGTLTFTEGENDADLDGNYVPLNGTRIPPIKITGYAEYAPADGWRNRLQFLYSGVRDRAHNAGVGFAGQEIDDFLVVDLISSFEVGPGTLNLGIANLLNADYHPVHAQLLPDGGNTSHVRAPGTTFTVSYALKW